MTYKPILIVLSTFALGLIVGLLLAGVVIRKQLEPVRNLQTAKGIKNMVSNIIGGDSSNRDTIFETVNETITEMQALDLAYRSEMQIYMDSMASDLQPLLNEQQYYALLSRIAGSRQTIKKRFDRNKHLQELEQRISGLEQQLEEQLQSEGNTVAPPIIPNSKKPDSQGIPNKNTSPSTSNPTSSSTQSAITSNPTQIVDRPFLRDILAGHYGGNPRFINAFFLMKFDGDTSLFENFVKRNFKGDTQHLREVLNKQFHNKKRLRHLRSRLKKHPHLKKRKQNPPPNPTPSHTSSSPPIVPDTKEQTLENESLNKPSLDSEELFLDKNFNEKSNILPPENNLNNAKSNTLTFPEQRIFNRIFQKRFLGDTLNMQRFIEKKFDGDTLQMLQEAKERMKQRKGFKKPNNRE